MTMRLRSRDRSARSGSGRSGGAAVFASAYVGALVLALAAIPAQSTAATSKLAPSSTAADVGGAMAVRELMRLDTELALSASRGRLTGVDKRSETALALSDQPGGQLRLVAIYGVGKRLLAEVLVGSQPYVYMRGHPLPIGAKAGSHVYKLGGISGSCVQLERQDEAHTLCLHPSLKASR
ncbi:MAG: hypothetical protein KA735_11905 [Burkholderiaceae bacterium]|nr:hypothetical protein [Burkholderiaceae bacterium]